MSNLPQDCITLILSLLSPRDACRMAIVSHEFRSASDSDNVWRKFLPHDYNDMILQLSVSSMDLNSMTMKALFFHLCDNPIIIDNGTASFNLEAQSGKKCLIIGSRALSLGDRPTHWDWKSLPESRFSEVAYLDWLYFFDIVISGKIETKILSKQTTYGAYFVYNLEEDSQGFAQRPVYCYVYFEGEEKRRNEVKVYLDPSPEPKDRGDGWMEIEIGEFFNEHGEDGRVLFYISDYHDDYHLKSGLLVEGIELRPKII